jgi:hypothetical protein
MSTFKRPVSLLPAFDPLSFKEPLSGNVTQSINPWADWFRSGWGQYGLININLGQSSAPDVERDVLDGVASYGKQLGRIGDVMMVLLKHFHPQGTEEENAIIQLKAMLLEIDEVKRQHGRRGLKP